MVQPSLFFGAPFATSAPRAQLIESIIVTTLLSHPIEAPPQQMAPPLTPANRLALKLGRWLIARAERPRPAPAEPRTIREDTLREHTLAAARAQAFGPRWN